MIIGRKTHDSRLAFYERFLLSHTVGSSGPIHIVRAHVEDEADRIAFVKMVQEALALIESADAYAYRMVLRQIRYIVNTSLDCAGIYIRRERLCKIDFQRYYKIDPAAPEYEWKLARLACTIVHEAMHGRIHAFGISYNRRTWIRVERLCVLREQRFARHLSSARYDFTRLVPPFDPARWAKYWGFRNRIRRGHLLAVLRIRDAGGDWRKALFGE